MVRGVSEGDKGLQAPDRLAILSRGFEPEKTDVGARRDRRDRVL
jgi:hypothetical protein